MTPHLALTFPTPSYSYLSALDAGHQLPKHSPVQVTFILAVDTPQSKNETSEEKGGTEIVQRLRFSSTSVIRGSRTLVTGLVLSLASRLASRQTSTYSVRYGNRPSLR